MAIISYFAVGQIELLGKRVREALAALRKQKLLLNERRITPTRNESLDSLLLELQLSRLRLAFQVRKLEEMAPMGSEEGEVLVRAKKVLCDALKLAELLIWFGADAPDEQILLGRISDIP